MSNQAERILIIGPSWVGDMVMAQTLFMRLKQRNPAAIIDVLALDWSRPLLERMPEVNQALSLPIGHGEIALAKGFRYVESGALVRSSYHAEKHVF